MIVCGHALGRTTPGKTDRDFRGVSMYSFPSLFHDRSHHEVTCKPRHIRLGARPPAPIPTRRSVQCTYCTFAWLWSVTTGVLGQVRLKASTGGMELPRFPNGGCPWPRRSCDERDRKTFCTAEAASPRRFWLITRATSRAFESISLSYSTSLSHTREADTRGAGVARARQATDGKGAWARAWAHNARGDAKVNARLRRRAAGRRARRHTHM